MKLYQEGMKNYLEEKNKNNFLQKMFNKNHSLIFF